MYYLQAFSFLFSSSSLNKGEQRNKFQTSPYVCTGARQNKLRCGKKRCLPANKSETTRKKLNLCCNVRSCEVYNRNALIPSSPAQCECRVSFVTINDAFAFQSRLKRNEKRSGGFESCAARLQLRKVNLMALNAVANICSMFPF